MTPLANQESSVESPDSAEPMKKVLQLADGNFLPKNRH